MFSSSSQQFRSLNQQHASASGRLTRVALRDSRGTDAVGYSCQAGHSSLKRGSGRVMVVSVWSMLRGGWSMDTALNLGPPPVGQVCHRFWGCRAGRSAKTSLAITNNKTCHKLSIPARFYYLLCKEGSRNDLLSQKKEGRSQSSPQGLTTLRQMPRVGCRQSQHPEHATNYRR